MSFTKLIAAAAASFSLISSSVADYDPKSQANVALYYGNGPNQQGLAHFCDQSTVDIIPIGFINIFPSLANGLVAENFGNQCYGSGYANYTGPGYNGVNNPKNNFLYTRCPQLQEDIYYCQTQTKKKLLLSLGGEGGNYQLNGKADGEYLADFLWGAYGPYNATWVAAGGVRPLDRGLYNTDASKTVDFDGFDFDIEQQSPDNQQGYIAAINRLRVHFADYKKAFPCSKNYIISGAPQCPLPDANMGAMINAAKFDLLWVQFYNNGANGCTARAYANGGTGNHFNFNKWVNTINTGASAGAQVYVGLLGSNTAGTPNDYIYVSEAKVLIDAYHGVPQFGGVMIYEATYADQNNNIQGYPNQNYYQAIKGLLKPYAPATTVTSTCVSTTTSAPVTSKTSSSVTTTSSKTTTTSSSTKTTTTAAPTSTVSTDGKCSANGKTCLNSGFGNCCSVKGNCGSSDAFCLTTNQCQPGFGTCTTPSTAPPVSTDGKCGANGATCTGSKFGTCCSVKGNCGTGPAFCGVSNQCQPKFGTCTPTSLDGKCGSASSTNAMCTGSGFGDCCSVKGNCGSSAAFCAASNLCQPMFGTCTSATKLKSRAEYALTAAVKKASVKAKRQDVPASTYQGCYSEAIGFRTLPDASVTADPFNGQGGMTIELCAAYCTNFAFYGVEYARECYCGNEINPTAIKEPETDCNMPCNGDTTETCGGPVRLNIYAYGAVASSSSSSSVAPTSTSSTSSSVSETSTSSSSVSETSTSSSTPETTTTSSSSVSETSTSSSVSETSSSSSSSVSASQTSSSASETSSSSSSSVSETSSSVSETSTSSVSSSVSQTSSSASETSSSSVSSSVSQTSSSASASVTSSSVSSSDVTTSSQTSTSTASTFTYGGNTTSASSTKSASSTGSVPVTSLTSSSVYATGPHYTNSSGVAVSTTSCTSTKVPTYTASSSTCTDEISSVTKYTTSTVYATQTYTISSCPPSVKNCPYGSVTTKTIAISTTICPVEATQTKPVVTKPVVTAYPTSTPYVTKYTTSTIYTTSIYTITSCAPSVTNCPAHLGQVTTEIIKVSTTICPVTESTGVPQYPGGPAISYSAPSYPALNSGYESSTTTVSSTTTQYRTVKVVMSTATLVPVPSVATWKPYPTGPATGGLTLGTAAPSVGVSTSASAPLGTGASYTAVPVPSATFVTGGASGLRLGLGAVVGIVAAVAVAML